MRVKPYLLTGILVAFWLIVFRRSGAAPNFVVSGTPSLTYDYPIPGATKQSFSFRISSSEGEITNVKVHAYDVRDPAGQFRSPSDMIKNVTVGFPEITSDGDPVEFTIDPNAFMGLGNYTIWFRLEGDIPDDKEPTKSKTITKNDVTLQFKCAPASLNIDELKDQTILLKRSNPWGVVTDKVQLTLIETSGKVKITNLKVVGQEIRDTQKTNIRGNVTVSAVPNQANVDDIKYPPLATEIPAGDTLIMQVNISNLRDTGDLMTQLSLSSPNINGRQVIPLKLRVSDAVGYPLFVILMGVVGGWLVQYLAQPFRSKRLNLLRILQLRRKLEQLRPVVQNVGLGILISIERKLRDAETKNDLEDFTSARAVLDDAEKELNTFVENEIKQKVEQLKKLNTLRERVKKAFLGSGVKPDDATLTSLGEQLTAVEILLNDDKIEESTANLATIEEEIGKFEKEHPSPAPPDASEDVALKVHIVIMDPQQNRTTESRITFRVDDSLNPLLNVQRILWTFGDKSKSIETKEKQVAHSFAQPGTYHIQCDILDSKGDILASLRDVIAILPTDTERTLAQIQNELRWSNIIVIVIAMFIASLTALNSEYVGKPFGSSQDYIRVFVWGFGLTPALVGFSEVMKRITKPTG